MITISASNPYSSYIHAVSIALGGKSAIRPTFKERKLYGFIFQDNVEEYDYTFDELNYKFIEELPVSDVTVFTAEDFGKFFYEYGRTLLGNLMICLTKADWNSVSQGSSQEATYVSNYLHSLLTLDDHIDQVVEEFKKAAIDVTKYSEFPLDYKHASQLIKDYKDEVQSSRYSKDMTNTDIFYVAWVGLMFTLYGLLLLLPTAGENKDLNVLSFLQSPLSQSSMELYKSILLEGYSDADLKKHFITLIYAYYKTTDFFRLTSGLADMDPVVGTLYDVSKTFMSKLDADNDEATNAVRALIDPNILGENDIGSGLTISSFTETYDPVLDILRFRNGGIIPNDNSNIWSFGDAYLHGYKYDIEEDTSTGKEYKTIAEIINPIMTCYMAASMKPTYTNEDVSRAFKAVTNLITLVDEDNFPGVNPGFILQLTIMAAAFRTLEKRTTQRSKEARAEINAAIDILDVLITRLYDLWFKSGKYFKQANRPRYGKSDACNETLKTLQNETDKIIFNYLEFVRFADKAESDKILLKTIKNKRILANNDEHLNEFINSLFDNSDQDTYIRLCGNKQGRSIVQTIYYKNSPFEFENLIRAYGHKELSASFIGMFAIEPSEHTGITVIDRVIDSSLEAKSSINTNPESYCVGIYGVIWVYLEKLLKQHNIGNYFDFGDANNSLASYNIEHIVADMVVTPLRNKVAFLGL